MSRLFLKNLFGEQFFISCRSAHRLQAGESGNVLSVITDKTIPVNNFNNMFGQGGSDDLVDHFKAVVVEQGDYYPFGMPMPMRSYAWYGGGKWLVLNRMLVSGESVTAVIDGNTETLCTYNSGYTDIDDYYTAITSALSSLGITATVDGEKLQLSGWNNDDALVSENDLVAIESNSNYRYGYNGMEKDNEILGFGVAYTAPFWEYDSRLGKRWNVDPVIKPWESPYAVFNNDPIFFNDPTGRDSEPPKTHRTISGDTYSKVAKQYGVSVEDLRNLNGYADDKIPIDVDLKLMPDDVTDGASANFPSIQRDQQTDYVGSINKNLPIKASFDRAVECFDNGDYGGYLENTFEGYMELFAITQLATSGGSGDRGNLYKDQTRPKPNAKFSGSLSNALQSFVPNSRAIISDNGKKIVYENLNTGTKVIQDRTTNQFRIQNSNGNFLDMNGKVVTAPKSLQGKEAQQYVREQTHFGNTDKP